MARLFVNGMKLLRHAPVLLVVCLASSTAWAGSARIVRGEGGMLRLTAVAATAAQLESALTPYMGAPVRIEVPVPSRLELEGAEGRDLAWSLARQTGAVLARQEGEWVILSREPVVTLDARAVDGTEIVRELARQCGVRNLMFDPGLPRVEGTFVFERVACSTAIPLVLRSLGWAGESAGNTIHLSSGARR